LRLTNAVDDGVDVRYTAGRGVNPRVQLDYVEDGLSERHVGDLSDVNSQHLVCFIALNPFTYTQRCVTVKNCVCVT